MPGVSSVVRTVWDNTYGLLVEDGSLAVGAIAAVVVVWLFAVLAPDAEERLGGALLLLLICALVLGNLFVAGRRIARNVR